MPVATRTCRIATARELADSTGITAADGNGFQLVDRYGVTYTGSPAHLTLVALARADLTPQLYRDNRTLRTVVRTAAFRVALWFTCHHVHPDDAAAFAALPPMRVCELVAHVADRGHDALSRVGPESLRFYTSYLLSSAVDDPAASFPTVIDTPCRPLNPGFDDRLNLNIAASAPDGADEVLVRLHVVASEAISWDFVAAAPVPTRQLNDLLMSPGGALGRWLDDNRELVDDHLDYAMSRSDQGIDTDARLVAPDTPLTYPDQAAPAEPAEPAEAAPRAGIALYFVGPDRDTAVTGAPFLDRAAAGTLAKTLDQQVFTTDADITAAHLRSA